jgi:PAS domain S-box-containing protein
VSTGLDDGRRLIDTIFDTAPIGIGLLDRDGRYVAVNEWLAEINGLARSAHVGRSVAELFGEADPGLVALVDGLYERGEPFSSLRLPAKMPGRADRQPGYYDVSYRPLADDAGARLGAILYVLDVTDRVRQDQVNQEFLAVLSHELRTPLNAILGWTTLLAKASGPQLSRGLAVIERNARAQSRLIEDLLDVSRMLTGRLSLNKRDADLCLVVEAAVETVRPSADARELRLTVAVPPAPVMLTCDPVRVQQVVLNLLSNAVKFTPVGGAVGVELARDGDGAVIAVRDTGIGIAADFLPYLFDRFRQSGETGERAHGLGLGLAIARDLVKLHGGTISAESAGEGQGTTMVVRLPG